MTKLKLTKIDLLPDGDVYRVIVKAVLDDPESGNLDVSIIELDYSVKKESADLKDIEQQALIKAERLLRLVLGDTQ